MSITSPPAAPPKVGGRPQLWLGLLATFAGMPLYFAQVLWAHSLAWPWYVPALAALGTALVLLSLLRRRTVWRVLALLVVGFLAGAESWFLFSAARLPSDTGRLVAKQEMPQFAAYRADGSSFTQDDLKGDKDTIIVFFRGRF